MNDHFYRARFSDKITYGTIASDLYLFYIRHHNDDLCMKAVSARGGQLKFVKNQTYDICKCAISLHRTPYIYIHDDEIFDRLVSECPILKVDWRTLEWIRYRRKEIRGFHD